MKIVSHYFRKVSSLRGSVTTEAIHFKNAKNGLPRPAKNAGLAMTVRGVTIFLLLFPLWAFAQAEMPRVNILTWWGYLDKPWVIDTLQEKCKVKVSYDEYFSITEFFRRFKEHKEEYDLVIFVDSVYDMIKDDIKVPWSTNLSQRVEDYHPVVKERFKEMNYPSNVTYFSLVATVLIYNPKLISVNQEDDIDTLFKKAGKNLVVFMDDPIEASLFLRPFSLEKFRSLSQGRNIFITNALGHIYSLHNLAFAYFWLGHGLDFVKHAEEGKYKFYNHKKYSSFSADLLAILKSSEAANCVAKALTEKDFLTRLQNAAYEFSPYGNLEDIQNPKIREIVQKTFALFTKERWMKPISAEEFKEKQRILNYIKLEAKNDSKNVN